MLFLSLSGSLIRTNKRTLALTLSSPLALVFHTQVILSCVCAHVLCALSISNTLERTCPTIVLYVLLVLLSAAVLLLLITTSTINTSCT
jgi:hypothetical protein